MTLPIIVLSPCLFLVIVSLIASRFDVLWQPAKWMVFAITSVAIVGFLVFALDREDRPSLGFVVNENCPPADQVAVITGSVRDGDKMRLSQQDKEAIQERIAIAKTQEAEARERAETAKYQESEARQRTKVAAAEESEASQRADIAKLKEREILRQLDRARAEIVQLLARIDVAKIQEAEARERADAARKTEAEARERADRAKAELIEAKHRADAAQAEAHTTTRTPKAPTIIRGGRKSSADNPM